MKKITCLILLILLVFAASVLAQEDNETASLPESWLTLNTAGQEAASILDELEEDGMIPSGASEIFSQNNLSYLGAGAEFSTFGFGSDAVNLLYSAVISFNPQSEDLEYCGIAARTLREETTRSEEARSFSTLRLSQYLLIGLDNRANLFVLDRQNPEPSVETFPLPQAIGFPIQITALLMENQLYVFANETLLVEGLEVTEGSGDFAFLYSSQSEETECTGTLLFAYGFPDELITTCQISTANVANKRQAATVDSRVLGQLTAGDSAEAIAQVIGADGFLWWQLSDDSWVRSDVVEAQGYCRALPDFSAS